jgi:FtsP/CotA-like multicopper oxidase with cupredoxin domain
LQDIEQEDVMSLCRGMLRQRQGRPAAREWSLRAPRISFVAGSLAVALIPLQVLPAEAQQRRRPQPQPTTEWVDCPAIQQPLIKIPEIVSQNGQLRGTIVLRDEQMQRLAFKQGNANRCAPQRVRSFQAIDAVLPAYQGMPPPGYGGVPPIPVNQTADPVPGPTLRARIGDIVQLAFLNHVNPNNYGDSIDRGERGQGCDESNAPYPGLDTFPDCFHGSSTGNIHFHGTHTNPSTTGDNVFIEIRPSLRDAGQPIVTQASVKDAFEDFFSTCEIHLSNDVLSQWPRSWSDLPTSWTSRQEVLLKAYDSNPYILNKLWPVNAAQIAQGAWPQYYVGAYPYCFRLPRYTPPLPTQSAHPASHTAAVPAAATRPDQGRALLMGQSPGTHWYHAHKHGSTTINVANGMTGAFIIEGPYDDVLNQFYNVGWNGPQPWTRAQPVLVLNQLGVSPNLERTPGPHQDISVNGRLQPLLKMRPGEVQLWRIANTSSRSGVFLARFAPPNTPATVVWPPFAWQQVAQDGVQFVGTNYQNSQNPQLLIAPGNRVDLLVKAPANVTPAGQPYALMIQQARSRCETLSPTLPQNMLPQVPTSPQTTAACAPDQLNTSFPAFLNDITDDEVKATKTVVFESVPTAANSNPATMHTIDGNKFDGNIGQVVLLNTVEEWKIINKTVNGAMQNGTVVTTDPPGIVDHPFHIHINPFQIPEVFDPNEMLPGPTPGTTIPKYIFQGQAQTGQCLLDANNPATWKPCNNNNPPQKNLIWWDVFPIPSARAVLKPNTTPPQLVVVPGYFKMRSRFVDYSGQYVLHCHILAHEDRGMMTIVEVVPFATAYSHK